jgi:hypothetical protein
MTPNDTTRAPSQGSLMKAIESVRTGVLCDWDKNYKEIGEEVLELILAHARALDAQHPTPSPPSSVEASEFVMVPREPTNGMLDVGARAHYAVTGPRAHCVSEIYKAMLAAAPTAPAIPARVDDNVRKVIRRYDDVFASEPNANMAAITKNDYITLRAALEAAIQANRDGKGKEPV